MTKWQKIETAPKDGEIVDIWITHSPERRMFDCRQVDAKCINGIWHTHDGEEWVPCERLTPLKDGGWWKATHWTYRPAPPKSAD